MDSTTGEPVEYCSFRLKHAHIGFLSDADGTFDLDMTSRWLGDTAIISCIGYDDYVFPANVLPNIRDIQLSRRQSSLSEVCVRPQKYSRKQIGKKHTFGLFSIPFYEKRGSIIGIESKNTKQTQWLSAVGFYIKPTPDRLSNMKFRVTVYDGVDVKGRETSSFKDCGIPPIYIDYDESMISDNRFIYRLPEPLLIPSQAMVAIEFLEDMGNERIVCRHNVMGGGVWTSTPSDEHWIKLPVATPFFIEILKSDK